ncbi:hypothetical protein A33M_0076 [Rhodovulum sp. PH10]|uniref:DUF2848 domain-containing protein n=1 Tax=Rhodovulum sp. PH10 TaxID=1187851 RepID=UPI00027C1D9B|nr:DUF2848 domain-containing protein [Rhodovulum sp. PH10]EJW13219.1 hypothetical protein A33M_0076 [Rhodovulum sp. PH10]
MPSETLMFRAISGLAIEPRPIALRAAAIALWTGRDPGAREMHAAELEAIGIPRPSVTPQFYRISTHRVTTAAEIEVVGPDTSGEVEFVLIRDARGLWVGVGSDHTDRRVERIDIGVSKQLCDKPIAPDLWAFDDVADHWDRLVLRSWVEESGAQTLYQEGSVSVMLDPGDIIAGFAGRDDLPEGTVLFCGTFAAIGGIRPTGRFSLELFDPVRERRIAHGYSVVTLPAVT